MTSGKRLCFRWDNHKLHVTQVVASHRENEDWSDISLVSGDGHVLRAHQAVLVATSRFFQNALSPSPQPFHHPTVVIHQATGVQLACILDYMYYGSTQVEKNLVDAVLDVADLLEVKGLSSLRTNPGMHEVMGTISSQAQPTATKNASVTAMQDQRSPTPKATTTSCDPDVMSASHHGFSSSTKEIQNFHSSVYSNQSNSGADALHASSIVADNIVTHCSQHGEVSPSQRSITTRSVPLSESSLGFQGSGQSAQIFDDHCSAAFGNAPDASNRLSTGDTQRVVSQHPDAQDQEDEEEEEEDEQVDLCVEDQTAGIDLSVAKSEPPSPKAVHSSIGKEDTEASNKRKIDDIINASIADPEWGKIGNQGDELPFPKKSKPSSKHEDAAQVVSALREEDWGSPPDLSDPLLSPEQDDSRSNCENLIYTDDEINSRSCSVSSYSLQPSTSGYTRLARTHAPESEPHREKNTIFSTTLEGSQDCFRSSPNSVCAGQTIPSGTILSASQLFYLNESSQGKSHLQSSKDSKCHLVSRGKMPLMLGESLQSRQYPSNTESKGNILESTVPEVAVQSRINWPPTNVHPVYSVPVNTHVDSHKHVVYKQTAPKDVESRLIYSTPKSTQSPSSVNLTIISSGQKNVDVSISDYPTILDQADGGSSLASTSAYRKEVENEDIPPLARHCAMASSEDPISEFVAMNMSTVNVTPSSALRHLENSAVDSSGRSVQEHFEKMNKKLTKPKNVIKRPPNMYILFHQEMRPKLALQHPNLKPNDIFIMIGQLWQALSQEEKKKWEAKANIAQEEHYQKYPDYAYRPHLQMLRNRAYQEERESKWTQFLAVDSAPYRVVNRNEKFSNPPSTPGMCSRDPHGKGSSSK